MHKHIIDDTTFTLELTEEDLNGVAPSAVTVAQATELVSEAIGGHERWDNLCLELYPSAEKLLIFAKMLSGKPVYFAFADFEDVIRACESCPASAQSSLTYLDGEYILAMYPARGEQPPLSMSDYGLRLEPSDVFAAHLREYGSAVVEANAMEFIRDRFA